MQFWANGSGYFLSQQNAKKVGERSPECPAESPAGNFIGLFCPDYCVGPAAEKGQIYKVSKASFCLSVFKKEKEIYITMSHFIMFSPKLSSLFNVIYMSYMLLHKYMDTTLIISLCYLYTTF